MPLPIGARDPDNGMFQAGCPPVMRRRVDLKRFIVEIHKRSIWHVVGVYLFAGWGAVEVIGSLTETAGLPAWFPAAALATLVLFFPVVLATALVRESTAESASGHNDDGSDDASDLTEAAGSPQVMLEWRQALLAGSSGMVLIALVGVWLVAGRDDGPVMESAPTAGSGGSEVVSSDGPSGSLSLTTTPTGVSVRLTALEGADSGGLEAPAVLATTPIERLDLAAGQYVVELTADGVNAISLVVEVFAGETAERSAHLTPTNTFTSGMVRVESGVLVEDSLGLRVPAFLIDQTEVSNEEFSRFVADGGYENPTYWRETLSLLTGEVAGREASSQLVDRTNLPGPRTWSGSIYAQGTGSLPVSSITWYEADAYCRWAGKRLPSFREWWRAALDDAEDQYPWGSRADSLALHANFSSREAWSVGSSAAGASRFGVLDLAGNVREWVDVEGSDDVSAMSVGGSWQDPIYTFDSGWRESLPLGLASENTGFRCVRTIE